MRTNRTAATILIGFLALAMLSLALPTVADAALPPRPTLTPTAGSVSSQARIVLVAGSAYEGDWTVVEWQGGDGVWHEVTGWQAHVQRGQVRWRVAEKDFGTGPFRWVIYDKEGGSLWAVSASFTLPTSNQKVTVGVSPMAGE